MKLKGLSSKKKISIKFSFFQNKAKKDIINQLG